MEKFGNRKSTIGLFASFLVLNSFKDNYLEDKEKNGDLTQEEIDFCKDLFFTFG